MSTPPVLEVEKLVKHFPIHGGLLQRRVGEVRAVDGVSFAIAKGETLGLVGESGCGKSTIGKTVLKLIEPTSGRILLGGEDVTHLKPGAMWPHRRRIQTIFQDPYSSMNPRLPAGTIVGEPLENFGIAHGRDTDDRVARLFERVGLRPDAMRKYAHEFSGGQRQRLGIAKALSVNPDLIVADEPVSALDVSVQAQVLNLLIDLQEELGLSLHQPRPRRDAPHQPSHRGDVSRPHRRARRQAHAVHPAAASLHRGTPVGRHRARPQAPPATQANRAGRRAEPGQAATRLPLPHALPLCHRRVPRDGAAPDRGRRRPPRRLPAPPHRRRSGATVDT
jgi:ABC-type dipeptide/oligopeptide/nickel transport system ATPase subunit